MSFNIGNLISSIFGGEAGEGEIQLATTVTSAIVGNATLSGLDTAARTAVKSLVTELDNGVDLLRSAFDKFETANPLVATGITLATTLATSQGLHLPTEDAIVTHVKAAIADIAAAFGFGAATPAAASTSTSTSTSAAPVAAG